MDGLTRDSHFVPRGYLKRWAHADTNIWAYRLLVSHPSVPEWTSRPIKGVAFRRDLYTSISESEEVDDFERWIEAEFETPGLAAIERATAGASLTTRDWDSLALYFAAQDLRTPSSYIKSLRFWEKELPDVIDSTLQSVVEELSSGALAPTALQSKGDKAPERFRDAFRVNVDPDADPENNMGVIQVRAVAGRSLWLKQQRYLLEGTAKVLTQHKWGIGEAAPGYEWLTSDHPALKVNYSGSKAYDFGGGWGRPKGNLMLPISPQHMLFCQIGDPVQDRFFFSAEETRLLQKLIAERAHRLIFSRRRNPSAAQYHERRIDADGFEAERKEWQNWHQSQVATESWDD